MTEPNAAQLVAVRDALRGLVGYGLSRRTLQRLTVLHEIPYIRDVAGPNASPDALAVAVEQVIRESLLDWVRNSDVADLGTSKEGRAVQTLLRVTASSRSLTASAARKEAMRILGLYGSPQSFSKGEVERRLFELLAARLLAAPESVKRPREGDDGVTGIRDQLGSILYTLHHDLSYSIDIREDEWHRMSALWRYAQLVAHTDRAFPPEPPPRRRPLMSQLILDQLLALSIHAPFESIEESRLRGALAGEARYELAPFLSSLEANETTQYLTGKWAGWLQACQCEESVHWDPGCGPHAILETVQLVLQHIYPDSVFWFTRIRDGQYETLQLARDGPQLVEVREVQEHRRTKRRNPT